MELCVFILVFKYLHKHPHNWKEGSKDSEANDNNERCILKNVMIEYFLSMTGFILLEKKQI